MSKKILVDTNCWLRFCLQDNKPQFDATNSLMSAIDRSLFKVYIPATVLLEVYFHLTKSYKQSPAKVSKFIKYILSIRNMTIVNCTDFLVAYDWNQKYNVKLADCLIVSKAPSKSQIITWDREFRKIPELKFRVLTPIELLNSTKL